MTSGTRAGTRIVGSLRSADGKGAVRMEDRYDTDVDDLWSALTDPRRLARWIAEVKGDLRLGGEFHARFTSSWEGAGRVDACEPPRRLLLTMSPGQDDETVIEARLAAAGDQTRLVIEERGLPPRRARRLRSGVAGSRRGPRRLPRRKGARRLAEPVDRAHPALSRPGGQPAVAGRASRPHGIPPGPAPERPGDR